MNVGCLCVSGGWSWILLLLLLLFDDTTTAYDTQAGKTLVLGEGQINGMEAVGERCDGDAAAAGLFLSLLSVDLLVSTLWFALLRVPGLSY